MLLRLRRGAVLLLALGGLAGGAGCKHDGGFQMTWSFAGDPAPASPLTCARHGVFSVRVTALGDSDGSSVAIPCGEGPLRHDLGVGTWTFTVVGLDADGHFRGDVLQTLDPGAPVVLSATTDATAVVADQVVSLAVSLPPLPACADGVDNDNDGRVDLDDPSCGGRLSGTDEVAPAGAPPAAPAP